MRRLWVIPIAFAVATVAARIALHLAHATPPSDPTQPLVVVTAWHALGALLLGLVVAAVGVAAIPYVAVLRSTSAPRLARTLGLCVLALAAVLLFPAIFSSDVYAYAAYGEATRIGLDAYAPIANGHGDPLLIGALRQWGGVLPLCVYGPAFVRFAQALVTLSAPFGTLAQLDAFRIASSTALPICAALLYAALRGAPTEERLRGAFSLALNPVALWTCAEGHNDALAVLALLAAIALVRRGVPFFGAFLAAAAALFKIPCAVVAAAIAVDATLARRSAFRVWIGLGAGSLFAAAFLAPWFHASFGMLSHGIYEPQASLQGLLFFAPWLAIAIALAVVAYGAFMLARGDRAGWCGIALGGWLLLPSPYPWYGLWLVPIARLAPKSRAAAILIGLSLTAIVRYVPDAVATPNVVAAAAIAAVALSPLLLSLRRPWLPIS